MSGSNDLRLQNVQQILTIAEPSFNKLAEIHGAVDYRREASFAIEALNNNSFLSATAMKDQDSFKRAIINVAAIGLSLNPVLKLAYLVPRKGKVCLDISYMGLIALAVEANSIKWAIADVVRENDIFTYILGSNPVHEFGKFGSDRGKIIGAYCVAKTNQDEFITIQMSIDEIFKIRERSESYKKGTHSPWLTDESEMIKKTVIRRASKAWPKTSTRDRIEKAEGVMEEADPSLLASPVVDSFKRDEQFNMIKTYLKMLDRTEDYYLEHLSRVTRRQIKVFQELTDIEIDQAIIALAQLVDETAQMPTEES